MGTEKHPEAGGKSCCPAETVTATPTDQTPAWARKTRFRLTLEQYGCVLGLLISQALFLKLPPVDAAVTCLVALYLIKSSNDLKRYREPFTCRQKAVLFGIQVSCSSVVVLALLTLALLKHTPLAWIIFALAVVVSFPMLFYGYEQLYKDGDSA